MKTNSKEIERLTQILNVIDKDFQKEIREVNIVRSKFYKENFAIQLVFESYLGGEQCMLCENEDTDEFIRAHSYFLYHNIIKGGE